MMKCILYAVVIILPNNFFTGTLIKLFSGENNRPKKQYWSCNIRMSKVFFRVNCTQQLSSAMRTTQLTILSKYQKQKKFVCSSSKP